MVISIYVNDSKSVNKDSPTPGKMPGTVKRYQSCGRSVELTVKLRSAH